MVLGCFCEHQPKIPCWQNRWHHTWRTGFASSYAPLGSPRKAWLLHCRRIMGYAFWITLLALRCGVLQQGYSLHDGFWQWKVHCQWFMLSLSTSCVAGLATCGMQWKQWAMHWIWHTCCWVRGLACFAKERDGPNTGARRNQWFQCSQSTQTARVSACTVHQMFWVLFPPGEQRLLHKCGIHPNGFLRGCAASNSDWDCKIKGCGLCPSSMASGAKCLGRAAHWECTVNTYRNRCFGYNAGSTLCRDDSFVVKECVSVRRGCYWCNSWITFTFLCLVWGIMNLYALA